MKHSCIRQIARTGLLWPDGLTWHAIACDSRQDNVVHCGVALSIVVHTSIVVAMGSTSEN